MQKQIILIALAVITAATLNAQTKIKDGTVSSTSVPNANALLDLESNNKGLLLPRIALDSTLLATPLSAHVAGMTVYNTATVHDVVPSFYFNDGTKWVQLSNYKEPWNVVDGTNNKVPATTNTQNIYQTGRVLIGFPENYTIPTATTLIGQKVNVNENLGLSRAGTPANFVMFRANGTFASPTPVAKDDYLGNILFEGWNGTARQAVVQLRALSGNNFTATANENYGYLDFMTRNIGEVGMSTKMRFMANGTLAIGTLTPEATAPLHIVKSATQLTPAIIVGCAEYADNAAALIAGLPIGALYRTGDVLKVVH